MELKELLCLLEKRLAEHDNSRKRVQLKLQGVCTKITERADSFEEKINGELQKSFNETEERILTLIEKLNYSQGNTDYFITLVQRELSTEVKYEIQHIEKANSFINSYKLKTVKEAKEVKINNRSSIERVTNKLQNHLNRIRDSMTASQDKLAEICAAERNRAEGIEKKISDKLEMLFAQEDARLQKAVNTLKESVSCGSPEEQEKLVTQAKTALLVKQMYVFNTPSSAVESTLDKYDLTVVKETSLEVINFEKRKPSNFTVLFTNKEGVTVSFTFFNDEEIELLKSCELSLKAVISFRDKASNDNTEKTLEKDFSLGEEKFLRFSYMFPASMTYLTKIKIKCDNRLTQWSDETEFITPEFNECCAWKKCPENIGDSIKYSLRNGSMNATKEDNIVYMGDRGYVYYDSDDYPCNIIGDTSIPLNKVTSLYIEITKSCNNNGYGTYIGVAPFDINQSHIDNRNKCGWYFHCYKSSLCSGPPHNYEDKEYGPRKEKGEYVKTGDSVGVVMDTIKGNLSFPLNRIERGVAYEGIPLDKPLVPCVILYTGGDSVELNFSKARKVLDSSILVPSNITANNSNTWDSITLTWDANEKSSFYQIEIDGNNSGEVYTNNKFILKGYLPETEHSFRVRTVRGDYASEWSGTVKIKTEKKSFETSRWKDYTGRYREYSIDDNNPRIATMAGEYGFWSTIIGNTPLPLNKVTSWNIKLLKSNNGLDIYIGVAPFDIDQSEDRNHEVCGWYFHCYKSSLYSGPPHNYKDKEYGPKKRRDEYVHTGDKVGVVMDTTKGELSFVVDNNNLGVAYEGIPLDKPLVPCVLLKWRNDSVELII